MSQNLIYTTAIIKNIIKNRTQTKIKSKSVNNEYIFITFFIPSIFVFFLILIILLKSFNIGFDSFERFKIMLAVIEAAFGAYVGLVLSSLFDIEKPEETKKKSLGHENLKIR